MQDARRRDRGPADGLRFTWFPLIMNSREEAFMNTDHPALQRERFDRLRRGLQTAGSHRQLAKAPGAGTSVTPEEV
jgi:hypothetical protein